MSARRSAVVLVAAVCVAAGLFVTPLAASAEAAAGPAGQASPSSLHFPDTYAEEDSAPLTVTMTSTGTAPLVIASPVAFDEDNPDQEPSFRIAADTCGGATLAPGDQCSVTVIAHPETTGEASGWLTFSDNSAQGFETVWVYVTSIDPTTGLYYQVNPHRVLDTRIGLGASRQPVTGGSTLALQVLGQGGVPADGVSAVVLNLTVTHPTTTGHVTAFASGTARPAVSSINYTKGWTGANLLTVSVGTDGKVDLYNSSGSVDLVADVFGWYAATKTVDASFGAGSGYRAETARRVLDTRHVNGAHQPVGPNQTVQVVVPITPGIPADDVRAVAVALTAVKAQTTGYLTAGAVGAELTATSTLNLQPGTTTPNLAIVPTVPSGGSVLFDVYNGSSHPVDVLVDVQGFYAEPHAAPYRFRPIVPTRIVDTREHLGASPLGPATTRTVTVPAALADYKAGALVANVTAVAPAANTVITLWSAGARPNVSSLNPAARSTVASGALVPLDELELTEMQFDLYNSSGTTNILVDVSGRFDLFQPDDNPII